MTYLYVSFKTIVMKRRIYLNESQLSRLLREGMLNVNDMDYGKENHFKGEEAPQSNNLKTVVDGNKTVHMSYDEDSNRLYIRCYGILSYDNKSDEYVYDGNTGTWENNKKFVPQNQKVKSKLEYIISLMGEKSAEI